MKNLIARRIDVHCTELAEQGGIAFDAIVAGIQTARDNKLAFSPWVVSGIPLLTLSDMASTGKKAESKAALLQTFCNAVAHCLKTLDDGTEDAGLVALESVVAMKLAYLNANASGYRQRRHSSKKHPRGQQNLELKAKALEMHEAGRSNKYIALELQKSEQTISTWLKAYKTQP